MTEAQEQPVSYKLDSKFSHNLYAIVCFVVIVGLLILIIVLMGKKPKSLVGNDVVELRTHELYGIGKSDCAYEKVFCFADGDCAKNCSNAYSTCVKGTCTSDIDTSSATNDCDPSRGLVGYLTGNTTLGTYEYICKSIDPGIAISVTENRMCYGDPSYSIDYLKTFPAVNTCQCEGRTTIPATSEKRLHVECDKTFHDLVPTT